MVKDAIKGRYLNSPIDPFCLPPSGEKQGSIVAVRTSPLEQVGQCGGSRSSDLPIGQRDRGGGLDKLAVDAKGRRPAVIKPRVVQRSLPPFEVLVMQGDIKALGS